MTRTIVYDPVNSDKWMGMANCVGLDPDVFFPPRGASTDEAKAICAACVVRDTCLDYALTHHIVWGIWGGKSIRQRRQISRDRREAAA